MNKEMSCMSEYGVFKLVDKAPSSGYQFAPLRMIFDIKFDKTHKSRLVVGGHVVDTGELSRYAGVMRLTSVRCLFMLAALHGLDAKTADVRTAYLNSRCVEAVYCRCGPEFGEDEGKVAILLKSLYGLGTAGHEWCRHLAITLTGLGYTRLLADESIWYQEIDGSPVFIGCWVDDLIQIGKTEHLEALAAQLRAIYVMKEGVLDHFLGMDMTRTGMGPITISCKDYCTETIASLERDWRMQFVPRETPASTVDVHSEEDDSALLTAEMKTRFQKGVGMCNWMVSICRPDLMQAVNAASRFSAAPRMGHWKILCHLLGYCKKYPGRTITMDPTGSITTVDDDVIRMLTTGALKDDLLLYPNATDIEKGLRDPPYTPVDHHEANITVYCDASWGDSRLNRRSTSAAIGFIGRAPVFWYSRRQTNVATSTFEAEYNALRSATEEIISLRFLLTQLRVKVTKPTKLLTDNESTVKSSSLERTSLKARHVALSYHRTREAAAAGITAIGWVPTNLNIADYGTKALDKFKFHFHTKKFMAGDTIRTGINMDQRLQYVHSLPDSVQGWNLYTTDVRQAYLNCDCDEYVQSNAVYHDDQDWVSVNDDDDDAWMNVSPDGHTPTPDGQP